MDATVNFHIQVSKSACGLFCFSILACLFFFPFSVFVSVDYTVALCLTLNAEPYLKLTEADERPSTGLRRPNLRLIIYALPRLQASEICKEYNLFLSCLLFCSYFLNMPYKLLMEQMTWKHNLYSCRFCGCACCLFLITQTDKGSLVIP